MPGDAQWTASESNRNRCDPGVSTTLIRCFPITELDSLKPAEAVARTLDYTDGSGVSWRRKFDGFIEFLTERCSSIERMLCLEAASRTQTGGIRVESDDEEGADSDAATVTLANVQVATGATRRDTRARLMRAFNTPFFPDILVCSEVMGEGVTFSDSAAMSFTTISHGTPAPSSNEPDASIDWDARPKISSRSLCISHTWPVRLMSGSFW
jgi:hypothetical protein